MLNSSFSSDLPAAIKELGRLYKVAHMKAASELVNRLLYTSPPNSISNSVRKGSPSRRPNKTAINKLKKRIHHDILGDNKVGSGLATGIVDGKGGVVWGSIKGQSSMPFLVLPSKKGRKRKKKTAPPKHLITDGAALVKVLQRETFLLPQKKTAHRVRKPDSRFYWVTLRAARNAARQIMGRAGYYISGWHALAKKTKNANFARIARRQYPYGAGSAEVSNQYDFFDLHAQNYSINYTKRLAEYCYNVIEMGVYNDFYDAIDREERYAEKEFNKWMKNNIK